MKINLLSPIFSKNIYASSWKPLIISFFRNTDIANGI